MRLHLLNPLSWHRLVVLGDGSCLEGPPVAVLVTVELDQSVTESAPVWPGGNEEDVRCFPWCTAVCAPPPLPLTAPGWFPEPSWPFGLVCSAPAHGSKENCTCNRLIKDQQHLVAHRTEFPQEVQSTLSFPVNSLGVTFPVQSVVKVNSKVFTCIHLHLLSQNVSWIATKI